MVTLKIDFSVAQKYRELENAIDSKRRSNEFSDWACRTLLAQWRREQGGSRMDDWVEIERQKNEKNEKLSRRIAFFDEYESGDLANEYDLEQLKRLNYHVTRFQSYILDAMDEHYMRLGSSRRVFRHV